MVAGNCCRVARTARTEQAEQQDRKQTAVAARHESKASRDDVHGGPARCWPQSILRWLVYRSLGDPIDDGYRKPPNGSRMPVAGWRRRARR